MTLPTLELMEFNLKLLGKKRKKRILISAGKLTDKIMLSPYIHSLANLDVELFTTEGTHDFLLRRLNLNTTKLHKISDGLTPNIASYLQDNRFDLIINILTGDNDYDENSDAKLIRKKSIEQGIPLITDWQIAIDTIQQIERDFAQGTYKTATTSNIEPWNMREHFLKLVSQKGGLTNHHAHFDKAYLITPEILELSQVDMQKKWELYKYIKENYTHDDLVQRISRGVESMIQQGVVYCRTMVDADSTVGLLPIKAALEVKNIYKNKIKFEIGVQPLQGVLDPASFEQYEEACTLADFCGGLPSRDRPQPERHLDRVLSLAKKLGKCVDVHVDQENNPQETETELLALKTIEHGMQGRVFGIHAISLAAKPEYEQDRIIAKIVEADMGIVICPSAAISMRQLDMNAPLHNSIAPFPKLRAAGVRCYLGIDNVHDLFMPMVDGDIWTECRMLMEATRLYDLNVISDWATAKLV